MSLLLRTGIENHVLVYAEQTNCVSGAKRTVVSAVWLEAREQPPPPRPPRQGDAFGSWEDKLILHFGNGPTGYESYDFSSLVPGALVVSGIFACAGTPGRWDSFYVPPNEMAVAFEALNVEFVPLAIWVDGEFAVVAESADDAEKILNDDLAKEGKQRLAEFRRLGLDEEVGIEIDGKMVRRPARGWIRRREVLAEGQRERI